MSAQHFVYMAVVILSLSYTASMEIISDSHTILKNVDNDRMPKDAERPSLQEFLAQRHISNDIDVYEKLVEIRMDWNTLLHIDPDDLEVLAKYEMNLPFKVKIKFKAAVKLMQSMYKTQTERIIHISFKESQQFDKIQYAIEQNLAITKLFRTHKDQIEQHSNTLKSQIDNKFETIFRTLESQKQSLLKKVEDWKKSEIQSVEKEISDSILCQNVFIYQKNKCIDIFKKGSNNKQREMNIAATVQEVFINSDKTHCEQYESSTALVDYIKLKTSLIYIEFKDDIVGIIDRFGTVNLTENNYNVFIPSINLYDLLWIPTDDNDGDLYNPFIIHDNNRYSVRIQWETTLPQHEAVFSVKYIDEHDKKGNDVDMEWIIADIKQIQRIDNGNLNQFAAEVSMIDKCTLDTRCKYKITMDIKKPIPLQISSNIIGHLFQYQKIELEEHSCRKYIGSYYVRYLFQNNAEIYASAVNADFQPNEKDWIVFKMNQTKDLYFPTNCMIKHRGDGQGIKKVKVLIGDGNTQWFDFDTIDVTKSAGKQYFQLNGVDWRIISTHALHFIKLEFIENHGSSNNNGCKYVLQQFELYGQNIY